MSRKFIIPTKENKIAILCTNLDEFAQVMHTISNGVCPINLITDDYSGPCYVTWRDDHRAIGWCGTRSKNPYINDKKIISFKDAIIQNRSYLAEVLGVEDNQNFKWRKNIYRIQCWSCNDFTELCYINPAGDPCGTCKLSEIIAFSNEIEFPIKTVSDEVLNFIKKFQWDIELFANGMCYWFAHILHNRFGNSSIEYHPIDNHFSCRIMNVNYDITGAIDGSGYVDWDEYQKFDPVHAERIKKYCIRKED